MVVCVILSLELQISLRVEAESVFFVGYPFGKKGWKVYDLEVGVFLVSRDVIFCENEFPFAKLVCEKSRSDSNPLKENFCSDDMVELAICTGSSSRQQIESNLGEMGSIGERGSISDDNTEHNNNGSADNSSTTEQNAPQVSPKEHLGRGQRSRQPPTLIP